MSRDWPPSGWQRHSLEESGHHYYVVEAAQRDSPSVLLLHEFPGMEPRTFVPLVTTLSKHFRVVAPSVLGRDGNPRTLNSLYRLCVRREVHVLAGDGVSRAAPWIRQVVAREFADEEAWAVIGMCLTGNFALALAVDPRVRAAVVAEPAVPVGRKSTGLNRADLAGLRANRDLQVRGYRFRCDPISPARKLTGAEEAVGRTSTGEKRFERFPLAAPHLLAHSVLTDPERPGARTPEDPVQKVIEFLTARLSPPSADPAPAP